MRERARGERHVTTVLLVILAVLLAPISVKAASSMVQITDGTGTNIAQVDTSGDLLVRGAPDQSPFQRTINIEIRAGDGLVGSEALTQVPKGKNLVLDYVSGWATTVGCEDAGDYLVWVTAKLRQVAPYQRFFVPMARTQIRDMYWHWQFGTPVHGVAGAGTTVYATLERYGGCGVSGAITVSGHFVAE